MKVINKEAALELAELRAALAEVRRESRVRDNVYPRLVFAGKLTPQESERRAHAMLYAGHALEAAIELVLLTLPTTGE